MCYWVGTRKVREVLLKQQQQNPENEIGQLFYNTFANKLNTDNQPKFMEHGVAIGKAQPTLTTLIRSENGLTFNNMNWTLNWSYSDSKTNKTKSGQPLLNSRCENVFWQHADLIYSKRCIIPVDGYWEFYHFKGNTFPYFIYPHNGGIFYLGGIFNEYVNPSTGTKALGFSILTTPPNEVTAQLHNNPKAHDGSRMLLIIDESQISSYLDNTLTHDEILQNFFTPYPASKMKYHSTVRFLKKEYEGYIQTDRVQEPFNYYELNTLF